ncbi:MAG TPA: hypothetical protein VE956_20040 [Nodularia sp. (in: cyanobacteria)]|nr:hypothetical protein [Nodularia sp. (in: cyanobacteria)]
MSLTKNAQSQEVSRGCEKRLPESQREGLGYIPANYSINGDEPVRICDSDSTGKIIGRKPTPDRDTTTGKILERLEAVETEYLENAHSYQAQLQARLKASHQSENKFREAIAQIKSDIYHLATVQKEAGRNGSN